MILALALLAVIASSADCTVPASQAGYTFDTATVTNCADDSCASPTITGVTCADGYGTQAPISVAGTSDNTACTSGGEVVFTGCAAYCKTPLDLGTDQSFAWSQGPDEVLGEGGADQCFADAVCSTAGADYDIDCAQFYSGAVTITVVDTDKLCTANALNVAVTSGCTLDDPLQCTTPAAAQAGYTFTVDTDIVGCTDQECTTPTLTGIACDTGYSGDVVVAACADSAPVVFSGCTASQCTVPATLPTGYVLTAPAAGENVADCTSAACGSPTGLTGLDCDTGYSGTAVVAACSTTDADAAFSGCTIDAVQCTLPATLPTGYTGMTAGADVTGCMSDTCTPTGVEALVCDTDYTGTVTITACVAPGTEVTLGGCTEVVVTQCTYPAAAQTGYTFTASDPITDCVVGACNTPTITATCDAGANYVGTVGIQAVCTDGAPAVVLTGCSVPTQCTVPDPVPTGYTGMTAGADVAGCTDVDCGSPTTTNFACDTGYEGTLAVAACSSSAAAAVFSGCTEVAAVACKTPAAAVTGYTFTVDTEIANCAVGACGTPTMTGITCADGYTGTPAVGTVCTDSALAVALSGCTENTDDSALSMSAAVAATIALAML